MNDPFAPATLGPVTLRNRVVKAATFEGATPDNVVTDRLIDFHRAVAAGGVGMTTVAFCAVSPGGAATPNEIVINDAALAGLGRLAEVVHDLGAAASVQIGHAGAVSATKGDRALAPSKKFSPLGMRFTRPATEDDIARVIDDFTRSAVGLADAGFDAVELHFGHGYLPSEFLSPRLNKRDDRWGGSLENRARLCREIATSVRSAVNGRLAVLAKLNMDDGVPGGFWIDESVQVAQMLESDGTLDAIELTVGSSLENPMYLFRGDAPIEEMAEAFPQPARTGFKFVGSRFLRSYPYEEAYLLTQARQFREALSMPLVLLGGINRRDTIERAMAEGFEFVAMGRALLREPDLVNRMIEGTETEGLCIHCNKCMPTIYTGTRCVLVEHTPPDNLTPLGIT